MKRILRFLIQSIVIIVISFSAFYILYYICLALFDINIIQHRHMHHFIAGAYCPYLYSIGYMYFLGYKENKENVKESIKTGCYVYIILCIGWECSEAIFHARGIQLNQLLFDFLGITLLYYIKRLWV